MQMTPKALDAEFEEYLIEEVRDDGDRWEIRSNGSWLSIDKVPGVPRPMEGAVARYYGKGLGYPVRGVDIGGREVYYRSVEEEERRHRQWVADHNAEKKAAAEAERDETARRIAALPETMRRRLRKFIDTNPDFWWEYLSYELFCCEEAVKVERHLRLTLDPDNDGTLSADVWVEALRAFAKDDEAQKPALGEGHSGNTHGFAMRLARHLLVDPELVVSEHGALTPLVGCEAYGCPHPTEEACR
jgi:hypothetical protein